MNNQNSFFDELKRRADSLNSNPGRDNESSRHDLLIYPIITSPFGLGWKPTDLISQASIQVPKQIEESHIFRDAIPKVRKPDILILPENLLKNVAVVEEKRKQENLAALSDHRIQLSEYQALYECTWGVLTDGEKWIIKKNFETYHQFASIAELLKGIKDFKNCVGSISVIERFKTFGTMDIVIVSPFSPILINAFPGFENIPVIVCGVEEGVITSNGHGYENFASLSEAIAKYPDLHPELCTKRFTWAMKERQNGQLVKLRFETWPANDMYSR
jgi:hypothetical protein